MNIQNRIMVILLMVVFPILLVIGCEQDVTSTETPDLIEVETVTRIKESPTTVVYQSPTPQTTDSPDITVTPSMSDITATPTVIPTSDLVTGWLMYQNSFYEYSFSYPPEAEIEQQGVTGFPTEELPENMTATEYRLQLKETYPDDICVTVDFQSGFVVFIAPWERGGKYAAPCGVSGVGDYDITPITETVAIDGTSYTAAGYEIHERNEEASWRGEFISLSLDDGGSIQFGGGLDGNVSYEEYLLAKETILRIISSFRSSIEADGDQSEQNPLVINERLQQERQILDGLLLRAKTIHGGDND